MPKIQRREPGAVAQPQFEPQQPTAGIEAERRAGQAIGRGVSEIGRGISDAGERIARRRDTNKAHDSYNNLYRDSVGAFEEELQNNGQAHIDPDNPEEIPTQRFSRILQTIQDTHFEGLSQTQKDFLTERISRQRNSWDARLAAKHLKDVREDALNNLSQSVDNYALSVSNDPESLDFVANNLPLDIAAAGLQGEDAQNMLIEGRDNLAREAALGIAQEQPETALELLRSGEWDDYLKDPSSKRELESAITTQKNRLKQEARDAGIQIDRDLQDEWTQTGAENLNIADVRTSPASAKVKSTWESKVKQAAKDNSPFRNSEPTVVAEIIKDIYDPTVNHDELAERIIDSLGVSEDGRPAGLSNADVQKYLSLNSSVNGVTTGRKTKLSDFDASLSVAVKEARETVEGIEKNAKLTDEGKRANALASSSLQIRMVDEATRINRDQTIPANQKAEVFNKYVNDILMPPEAQGFWDRKVKGVAPAVGEVTGVEVVEDPGQRANLLSIIETNDIPFADVQTRETIMRNILTKAEAEAQRQGVSVNEILEATIR
jgi:hypothetical protein